MAVVPAMDFETYWKNEVEALRAAYKEVITTHPEAKMTLEKVHEVLTKIGSLAGCTPGEVGRSKEWTKIVEEAEASRISLCDLLEGETLFSALYGVYSLALTDLKKILQNSKKEKRADPVQKSEEIQKEKRKRRNSVEEETPVAAKKQEVSDHHKHKQSPVKAVNPSSYTKNFFAPLRDLEMKETVEGNTKENETSNPQ